jgi:hypothetical protein
VAVPASGSSSSSSSSNGNSNKKVAAKAGSEGRETYVGDWEEDMRSGQGLAVYADGGRYESTPVDMPVTTHDDDFAG